jgi:hypothetical protein
MDPKGGDEDIHATGLRVGLRVQEIFRELFESVDRTYDLDYRAAGLMFIALIRAVPQPATDSSTISSDEALIEILASFVERGLLNPGSAH